MGIAVLGPLQVEGGAGALAPRDRVVLAVLVMYAGEVVPADRLSQALWGEAPPATWTKALQGSMVRLRKLLGASTIETVGHGYRLTSPPSEVDARGFERLLGRAQELLELGEPDRAAYVVEEALGLWRGRPLADLEDWDPGRAEADRLEELRRDAEELRVDAGLRGGRHREVLTDARRLVEQAPLRERRWELLALAQYRSGQQADALRTLQQLRRVLVSELGLDPGPGVLALEQAILRQDPELLPGLTMVDPSDTCPYLGLVPYDVADTEAFFGRQADIEGGRRRLAHSRVLAVVGPSGSGKSSLVRAGLVASLRRDGERVVVITPGRRPLAALTGVPKPGPPVVLVVDQAEEAVTLCEDADEVSRFFAALVEHAGRGRLVIALRADRFGDLAAHVEFARLVERGLYLLTPMDGDSLREAIEGPARQAGLRLEAGLVELLVSEVEGQPGALPYLSHALRQTWDRREGGVLTLAGYRATGGIREAVARSAEQVYEGLPADQRTLLRDMMLRLVTPGPEGEPVSSRIPSRQLSVDEEHDRVMELLVAARLVTSDDGVVEIAHEALVRAWPRLRGWLDDDTEGQRILRHLSVAADTWQTMGRPEEELYRGPRLAQALQWRERSTPDLTPVEATFLDAGDRRARQEEQSALEQATYQARVNRRLRGLLVGAALLLIAALVTGTLAVRQANRAAEATRSADARRVAAQAQLAGNVDRALALAAAAQRVEESAESRAGLLAALARSPQLAAVRPLAEGYTETSPDGRTLVVMASDHKVRFYDTETYVQTGEYDPYPGRRVDNITGWTSPLAFNPDGSLLAVGLLTIEDGVVRLVDPATHEPFDEQPGGQPKDAYTNDVDFSRDGRLLAVSVSLFFSRLADRDLAYVWDLRRPERPLQRIHLPDDAFHVEFSPDASRLHAAPASNSDTDPGLWTYATRTGELLRATRHGGHMLESAPGGRTLAYGSESDVVLVDESSGEVLREMNDPGKQVSRVAWSRDGQLVAAVSADPAAWVWEAGTGRLLERIPLEAEALTLEFDRAGERLLVPYDGRLHAFDLTGADRYIQRVRVERPGAIVGGFARFASPYAPVVAISTYHPRRRVDTLVLADRKTEQVISRLGLHRAGDDFGDIAWSPDGRHLASFDPQDRLRVNDARTGELVARRRLPGDQPSFTADGSRLLVNGSHGLVLLDTETLRAVTEPVRVRDRIAFSELGPGDGTAVVVTAQRTQSAFDVWTAADRWSVIDLGSAETLRTGALRASAASMSVSPDRTRMAVASSAGVEVVDLATGASSMPGAVGGTAEMDGWLQSYSPDGRLLVTSDGSGRVSLWDGRTGVLLGTAQPGDRFAAPLFLNDHTVMLLSEDGSTYVWDTSPTYAVDTACRIVGHGLSREEWQVAFGDRPYVDVCG